MIKRRNAFNVFGFVVIAGLLAVMSRAQQDLQAPVQPVLRVQTDVVVVPFEVRRGSRSLTDLKSSDVVLLEDGVRRTVTGFEPPSDHPTLELVLMFDVADVERGGFWSADALHDITGYWTKAITQALLEQPSATMQFSVYQFDQFRLRRLCRSTSDPTVLLGALARLSETIPTGQGFDLPLPQGVAIRPEDEPKALAVSHAVPWSRSLLAALAVLRDSTVGPGGPARALVIFSSGAEGTTLTPENLADQAEAADVPIYPVALPTNQGIRYEGYPFDPEGPLGVGLQFGLGHGGHGRFPQCRMCLDPDVRQRLRGNILAEGSIIDCRLNVPFEDIG